MPDAPKCPACKVLDLNSQTYKMAGMPKFRCGTCKKIFNSSDFKPEDFEWKKELQDVRKS